MANWWESSPLAEPVAPASKGGNWWESAPLAEPVAPAPKAPEAAREEALKSQGAGGFDPSRLSALAARKEALKSQRAVLYGSAIGLSPLLLGGVLFGLSALARRKRLVRNQSEEKKSLLQSLNGWQRLGIVISALWMLVVLCGALLWIETENDVDLLWMGLVLYAPLVLLWGLGAAAAWVVAGFKERSY